MSSYQTDRQFLALHLSEFLDQVVGDMSLDDWFLMLGNAQCDLGFLIHARFIEWRRAHEQEGLEAQGELDLERASDARQRL